MAPTLDNTNEDHHHRNHFREVDVVELQSLQARLDAVENVTTRRAARVRAGSGLAEDPSSPRSLFRAALSGSSALAR
jgi:hypothetical protein